MDADATHWSEGLRARPHSREEVAIVQRTRLGHLLVALGLVVVTASGLVLALIGIVRTTSVATDASAELIEVDVVRAPIEAELASAAITALPPGLLSDETAAAVAARMVRDSAVVDEIATASADAHALWIAGAQPVLILDPAVVTPATIAALRDIDLDLARILSSQLDTPIAPSPIALPVTPTSSERVESAAWLARLGLIIGLAVVAVGAALDQRRDRTVRSISTAMITLGLVLVAAPLLARLPDTQSWDWWSAFVVELVAAGVVSLVLGGLAGVGLGAFLRAVANQMEPAVVARIATRERDAVTPPPATTGAHVSRRRGRQVRQQAIDAFFGPEDDDAGAPADAPQTPASASAPAPTVDEPAEVGDKVAPRRAGSVDGFDRAVDAVHTAPEGPESDPDLGDHRDGAAAAVDDGQSGDEADGVAADRRESLERIDGQRSPLRTHLPR